MQKAELIKRKVTAKYSLIITATDNGDPRLSSTAQLDIIVLAVSDTPPKFGKLGYVFNITENNEVGATIGRIDITATENLKNNVIKTEILNDDHMAFSIDVKGNVKVCSFTLFFLFWGRFTGTRILKKVC